MVKKKKIAEDLKIVLGQCHQWFAAKELGGFWFGGSSYRNKGTCCKTQKHGRMIDEGAGRNENGQREGG